MANYTQNYQLEKPLPEDFYDVGVQNGNMDKIDATIAAIDAAKAGEKGDLVDDDALSLTDSADSGKIKRVLWSTVKIALANLFVPLTRKVNGKALSSDVTFTGEDIPMSATDNTPIGSVVRDLIASNAALAARVSLLELALTTDISANPFTVTFATLDGADVTGVWNKSSARIEF